MTCRLAQDDPSLKQHDPLMSAVLPSPFVESQLLSAQCFAMWLLGRGQFHGVCLAMQVRVSGVQVATAPQRPPLGLVGWNLNGPLLIQAGSA